MRCFFGKDRQDFKDFYKQLWKLVLPIALQNFLSSVVSASDALMLGMLNQDSLSAISLAAQVQFVLSLFSAALIIGATVLAAQYWGKGDKKAVEHVLAISLRLSVLISTVFFLAAAFCPGILMRLFTNDTGLIILGIPYLRIVSGSYLCMGISQIYLCIMKNSGRTFKSTIYGSVAVVLNLILNAIFIFGLFGMPKMEIRGAAYATLISRAVELLLVLWENCKRDVVRIRLKYLINPASYLKKDFYRYTMPVLANELVWGCGFTMTSVIMGHLGSDAVAANSIASIARSIIACVCMGIGTGSGIMVGNELGKGDLKRAKTYGDKLCHVSIGAGAVSGLIVLAAGPMISLFAGTLSAQASLYLRYMLIICSVYMVGKSINCAVIAGIFCAGGDTKFGMICDAVNMWLVIVPLGMLAAFVWKLPVIAVYLLLNLDEIIKLPAVYLHYKKYRWVKNLTKQEDEE